VTLAVHDRQLFDYVALDLSPAFSGDRLNYPTERSLSPSVGDLQAAAAIPRGRTTYSFKTVSLASTSTRDMS
jgi:hypothetical protein